MMRPSSKPTGMCAGPTSRGECGHGRIASHRLPQLVTSQLLFRIQITLGRGPNLGSRPSTITTTVAKSLLRLVHEITSNKKHITASHQVVEPFLLLINDISGRPHSSCPHQNHKKNSNNNNNNVIQYIWIGICSVEWRILCDAQAKRIALELRSTAVSQLFCDKDQVVTFGYSHA